MAVEENAFRAEVTSIESLAEYAHGAIVQLPGFGEGQPFFARLRRPSLMALIKNGQIPNDLLSSANALFDGGSAAVANSLRDDGALKKVFDVVEVGLK